MLEFQRKAPKGSWFSSELMLSAVCHRLRGEQWRAIRGIIMKNFSCSFSVSEMQHTYRTVLKYTKIYLILNISGEYLTHHIVFLKVL